MLDQKQPNRDDASKRMQPAQKERMPLTSPQWGYTLFDANRSGTAGSRCHKVPCELRDGERTFYYVGAREGKSRKASAPGCRADQVWSLQDLVAVRQHRQSKSERALRLRRALVDNHHSLILFTNDDGVGSIISRLPEHIAVRQLASQPEGIVQDEANVAFLFQKVE
jgi:hypothetical protein